MTQANEATAKYLVNCQAGVSDPERATLAFILAFTASKTNETAMFISGEATELVLQGGADKVTAPGYEPLSDLLNGYIENGGQIWLCPACVKAKQVGEGDIIPGVEVAGAPKTMAYLASGAHTLI
ncbi:MAG: DsrE family protein [Pseudomonadota bacterium]